MLSGEVGLLNHSNQFFSAVLNPPKKAKRNYPPFITQKARVTALKNAAKKVLIL